MAKSTAQKFGRKHEKNMVRKGSVAGDLYRESGLDRAYISNVEHGK